MGDVRQLIQDYLEAVRRVVSALRAAYGQNDLLSARRRGEIPKEGMVNGIDFSFHGVGCRCSLEGVEVDFDFGPDGRVDGFDSWRLWDFAKQRPAKHAAFQNEEDVEAALEGLAASGRIERPRTAPSPHLWYLKP